MNLSGQPADDRDHPPTLPAHGRLLGIDFGTVRVGVALCDADQSIASPLQTYTRRNQNLDSIYFLQLVATEKIVGIVVGLPVHLSGDESQKSVQARKFGHWLGEITGLPVAWVDERYSTARAEELLLAAGMTSKQRKARLDKVAAQSILSVYLESGPSSDPGRYF
jgi:putative Holliday junction resolvase